MRQLRLTLKADFGVIYEADLGNYDARWLEESGMTKEIFVAYASKYASIGFTKNGVTIGGAFYDGKVAHLAVMPAFHGQWGVLWRPTLAWLSSQKDPMFIEIYKSNTKCIRFMERNHWRHVGSTDESITFEATAKNHLPLRGKDMAVLREDLNWIL